MNLKRKLFHQVTPVINALSPHSGLHMIIMDELDAICKQRGSTNSGTGVHDTVVNQLLSKIDGVEQLNNILIIGMTNRYKVGQGLNSGTVVVS